MGWAKYYEDNLEIIYSRQKLRGQSTENLLEKKVTPTIAVQISIPAEAVKVHTPIKERKDQYIVCKDCGRKILFSVRDQLFYEKKGWNPPKRCKPCREFRKTCYLMRSAV